MPMAPPIPSSRQPPLLDPEPGSIWLSQKKDEKPWPVVVCNEEMLDLVNAEASVARPAYAQRPNGTWPLVLKKVYPTMRLVTMIL